MKTCPRTPRVWCINIDRRGESRLALLGKEEKCSHGAIMLRGYIYIIKKSFVCYLGQRRIGKDKAKHPGVDLSERLDGIVNLMQV